VSGQNKTLARRGVRGGLRVKLVDKGLGLWLKVRKVKLRMRFWLKCCAWRQLCSADALCFKYSMVIYTVPAVKKANACAARRRDEIETHTITGLTRHYHLPTIHPLSFSLKLRWLYYKA
jgi:hypothetical protein